VQERGCTVKGALNAAHVTMNNKATCVVFFLLHDSSMQRNGQRWDGGKWKVISTQRSEWRWVGSGRISGQGVSRYYGGDVSLLLRMRRGWSQSLSCRKILWRVSKRIELINYISSILTALSPPPTPSLVLRASVCERDRVAAQLLFSQCRRQCDDDDVLPQQSTGAFC
jgi:hypothetical protein